MMIVMMGTFSDGTQDTYIYTTPTHDTLKACQQYVYDYATTIRKEMFVQFDGKPIEKVFCIEEKKLKQFFEVNSKRGNPA